MLLLELKWEICLGVGFQLCQNGDAKKIEEDQNAGKLQSYRIATYLWTRELNDRLREGDEHLIIDGSPRSPKEASLLIESITEDFGRNPIIISLSISDETAVSRIKERNKLLIEAGKAPRQESPKSLQTGCAAFAKATFCATSSGVEISTSPRIS
jgi:adenylate kinase family enzyme